MPLSLCLNHSACRALRFLNIGIAALIMTLSIVSCSDFDDLAFSSESVSRDNNTSAQVDESSKIANIVIRNVTYSPAFDAAISQYSAFTLFNSITITVFTDATASLHGQWNGYDVVLLPNAESDSIALVNGPNIFTVYREDEITKKFTITITKQFFTETHYTGSQGTVPGQFQYPRGIAVRGDTIYVVDSNNHRIQIFNTNGEYQNMFGTYGTGSGDEMRNPYGIAIDWQDNIYITDTNNHRIKKFDTHNNCILQWGSNGANAGQFNFPIGIAIDSDNNVYVADTYNNRIQKFDADGNFVTQWGTYGTANGQFKRPYGIAVAQGYVYVADTYNNRIQQFTTEGQYVTQWGSYGSDTGQFRSPYAIAGDSSFLYVTEYNGYRVQVFTYDGGYVTSFGSVAAGPNQLRNPFGIAITHDGRVVVVEEQAHRFKMFELQ